nr:immunoglobulin heavy chain junction region [Macaca mulatta]
CARGCPCYGGVCYELCFDYW